MNEAKLKAMQEALKSIPRDQLIALLIKSCGSR